MTILKGQPQLTEFDEKIKRDNKKFVEYAKAVYQEDIQKAMKEIEEERR